MANTDKQNFRYDGRSWRKAVEKTVAMRRQGFDIDMTKLLGLEIDRFLAETTSETAQRLDLVPGEGPAPTYRRPYPRAEAAS